MQCPAVLNQCDKEPSVPGKTDSVGFESVSLANVIHPFGHHVPHPQRERSLYLVSKMPGAGVCPTCSWLWESCLETLAVVQGTRKLAIGHVHSEEMGLCPSSLS